MSRDSCRSCSLPPLSWIQDVLFPLETRTRRPSRSPRTVSPREEAGSAAAVDTDQDPQVGTDTDSGDEADQDLGDDVDVGPLCDLLIAAPDLQSKAELVGQLARRIGADMARWGANHKPACAENTAKVVEKGVLRHIVNCCERLQFADPSHMHLFVDALQLLGDTLDAVQSSGILMLNLQQASQPIEQCRTRILHVVETYGTSPSASSSAASSADVQYVVVEQLLHCSRHRLETCDECKVDFQDMNGAIRMQAESSDLLPPRSPKLSVTIRQFHESALELFLGGDMVEAARLYAVIAHLTRKNRMERLTTVFCEAAVVELCLARPKAALSLLQQDDEQRKSNPPTPGDRVLHALCLAVAQWQQGKDQDALATVHAVQSTSTNAVARHIATPFVPFQVSTANFDKCSQCKTATAHWVCCRCLGAGFCSRKCQQDGHHLLQECKMSPAVAKALELQRTVLSFGLDAARLSLAKLQGCREQPDWTTWTNDLTPARVYKYVIDSYRLRSEDELTVSALCGDRAAPSGVSMEGFQSYLTKFESSSACAAWWGDQHHARVCEMASKHRWANASIPITKRDIVERYNDPDLPWLLRNLAAHVLQNPVKW